MSDYIDFVEESLELGINYGVVGGQEFKTTIIENGDGTQQRNARWWLPLGRWQLGEKTLLESNEKEIAEVTYLKEFHEARKGSKQGFRFKDWGDYKATNQEIGITDGDRTQWQLKKTYYAGFVKTDRPITKPIEGTVKVYLDGAEKNPTEFSVDYTTGLLTFNPTPNAGAIITCDFEFEVIVCFENDTISWELLGYQFDSEENPEAIYKLGSVFVREIRIPLSIPSEWNFLSQSEITEPLDLGILLDSSEKIIFNTSNTFSASGYVRKDSNWNNPKTIISLPSRSWNNKELEKILGYFWNSKGRQQTFELNINNKKYFARFEQDKLNIRFQALQGNESLFNISGLSFEVTEKPEFPALPVFAITPEFFDFGLGITPTSLPVSQNYNESNSFSSGGGSGGGSGSGSGGGGSTGAGGGGTGGGFSVGFSDIPLQLPGSFTPIWIGELNGYPFLLGSASSKLFMAKPVLPFNGIFTLEEILADENFGVYGWINNNAVSNIRIRGSFAYFLCTIRATFNSTHTYVVRINPDFSWNYHRIATQNVSPEFYMSANDIYINTSSSSGTIDQPSFVGVKLKATWDYRNNIPDYRDRNSNFLNNSFRIYGTSSSFKVATYQNGSEILINDFSAPYNFNSYPIFGDHDSDYNNGAFIIRNIKFCEENFDIENPDNCAFNERSNYIAVYERYNNNVSLVAAFPNPGGIFDRLISGREVYFKRNLIFNDRYVLNIPNGTLLDLTDLPRFPVTPIHICAGKNYLSILHQDGAGNYKISYGNFLNS